MNTLAHGTTRSHRHAALRGWHRLGIIALACLGILAFATTGGADVTDVSSLSEDDCLVTLGTPDIAQSFLPQSTSITGASVKLRAGAGDSQPGDVTISLWTALPNDGGVMLQSATATDVRAGEFAEVYWTPVGTVANDELRYLVISGSNPSLCLAGATSDAYANGQAYAGAGFVALPSADFVFETFALESEKQLSNATVAGCLAPTSAELVQSFVPVRPGCAGAAFHLHPSLIGTADFTVELWDAFPGDGTLLASGEARQRSNDDWVAVAWPSVEVEADGATVYYLRVLGVGEGLCMSGNFGVYESGTAFASGNPLGDWDYAFEVIDTSYPCLYGRTNGSRQNVLQVNGSPGSSVDHVVTVNANEPIVGTIFKSARGGNGKYVVHANFEAVSNATSVRLPLAIGTVCHPLLLPEGGDPDAVWTQIRQPAIVGASRYFDGASIPDPAKAPAIFLYLPDGDATHLPPGTEVTLQGVIVDPASMSSKRVSATNAVIVRIQ